MTDSLIEEVDDPVPVALPEPEETEDDPSAGDTEPGDES